MVEIRQHDELEEAIDRPDDRVRESHSSDVISGSEESLWWLALAPSIWAVHFLACYLTAAIWCAKAADPGAPITAVRIAIAVYTVVALVGIAITFRHGHSRHATGTAAVPHDFDTPQDRHRFLGFATLLLAGLSAVAVLYSALVAVWFGSCR